jgi:diguanylate cyclase
LKTLIDWLLTNHPHRRARLQLSGVATLLMIASVVVLNLLAHSNGAPVLLIYTWTFFALGGLVTFFLLIRTGYSERWQDPSMTLVQITYAIAANAVAYVLAGEGRGVVPSILAVILIFSMFGLTVRQTIFATIFALFSFGVAEVYIVFDTQMQHSWVQEVANFIMILVVLGGGFFLTYRLQYLRQRLRTQKNELEIALKRINEIALFDELTGLNNRRSMNEMLNQESRRNRRGGPAFAIALLDIDHFKRVNDRYGHGAGDVALKSFAETAQQAVRESDLLCRWGGEEFLVMLPETTEYEAIYTCLNRVRECIAALSISYEGEQFSFTVSIGFSLHKVDEKIEHTIDRADQALYKAKQTGRNRVIADLEIET